MNEDDLKKLVDGNPDELIKWAEERGIDFSGLSKDIARTMVRQKFALSEEQFEAVDFVFWMSYMVERDAEELIIEPEVHIGARKTSIELLVSRLHFGDKIKVIEQLYTSKDDPFVKLMRQIQDLRNDVAHGRFNNLKYGGYSLSDNRGKLKLIANLRDALRKKQKDKTA
jgi:hypothetical protein